MQKTNRRSTNLEQSADYHNDVPSALRAYEHAHGPVSIDAKVRSLEILNREALVAEWIKINKRPPPLNLSRGFLLRAITYQIQEADLGGLKKSVRERLRKIAAGINAEERAPSQVNPGTRFLREWHGVTHEVVIEERGVRYQGKIYRSLSEVAQVITGTKWSGPMFFGLKKRSK